MNFLSPILFWVTVVFLHEFGHLVLFRVFGREVGMRINLLAGGAETGTAKDVFALNPHKVYTIALAGIISGYLPFFLVKTPSSNVVIYCAICVGDVLSMLYMLTYFDFKAWAWKTNAHLIDLELKRLHGVEKELKEE